MNPKESFSTREVLEILEISEATLRKLAALGILSRDGIRWIAEDVEKLALLSSRKYALSAGGANFALALPTTSPDLGASLFLSEGNGRQTAVHAFEEALRNNPELEVSGWWQISEQSLRNLENASRLILGVVPGGFVLSGAALAEGESVVTVEGRRALLVRRLTPEETAKIQGRVPKTPQSNVGVAAAF